MSDEEAGHLIRKLERLGYAVLHPNALGHLVKLRKLYRRHALENLHEPPEEQLDGLEGIPQEQYDELDEGRRSAFQVCAGDLTYWAGCWVEKLGRECNSCEGTGFDSTDTPPTDCPACLGVGFPGPEESAP